MRIYIASKTADQVREKLNSEIAQLVCFSSMSEHCKETKLDNGVNPRKSLRLPVKGCSRIEFSAFFSFKKVDIDKFKQE